MTRSFTIVPREPGVIVAVGSDSGYLCAFDAEGAPLGRYHTGEALQAMAVGDVNGDGMDEIVALTHQPDRAVVLGL